MASSNSVLNIVIRARDLAKGTLTKVTARLRGMGKASEQTESRFASLGRSIRNLVVASLGFYTIKKSMQSVLQTGDQFERLEVQMKAIMGSIEEGDRAIEWIKEFTKNTPLELQQVADAFTALKNFGLDPMDGTLQAIVDQTSKLGGGMERLNGISLALGQAWAKQKLQGEEILQLVERGVPVWSLLEKVTGKNTQELQKLSSAGQLGRETIKQLIEEIGKSSAGAAKANMGLLSGIISNLSDEWLKFKDRIAEAGWLDYVKAQLSELGSKLDEMAGDGRLQALAESISRGFIKMAEAVKASFSSINFEDFVSKVKTGFTTVSDVLGSLRSNFSITSSVLKGFFNAFSAGVKTMGMVFSGVAGSITKNASRMFAALGADETAEKLRQTSELMKNISATFKKELKQDIVDMNDAWNSFSKEIADSHRRSQQDIRNENKKTTTELAADLDKTKDNLNDTAEVAKKTFTDAADALKQINAAETSAELADLGVVLVNSFQEGKITQEQYNEALEASKQKLEELKGAAEEAAGAAGAVGEAAADGADKVQSTGSGLTGFYNNITSELYGLSAQAEDTFQAMQGATDIDTTDTLGDIGQLKVALVEAKEEAHSLSAAVSYDPTGLSDWMIDTAENAANVKAEFYEQKIALEELVQGYEDGSVSAKELTFQGEAAARSMDLLNQQDLDRLNSAIDSAESSMDSLNNSTRNTLEGLQDELDRLQDNKENIEQRQFESRSNDLQKQLQQATQEGDRESIANLNQALSLNQKIYSEKRKQLQQQKQEEVQRKQQSSQKENSRINSSRQRTQDERTARRASPDKVIRLEYPGGSVNVGVNKGDEAKLLEALKNAGMRSR
ncbi:tape measure protein [Endozoicomonas montiporae]|uniref:Mu-like prophage protein n=1 Tax=Endozoicomonas montiporae CL-33 TaxID=570277 RepID=A0A142BHP2_9GAMM|nr:tape measure protein [Endozoicomonas montiporae]AMO58268.1 Mu-like prophage protein [Endozoicomonas montiporae CL-33]